MEPWWFMRKEWCKGWKWSIRKKIFFFYNKFATFQTYSIKPPKLYNSHRNHLPMHNRIVKNYQKKLQHLSASVTNASLKIWLHSRKCCKSNITISVRLRTISFIFNFMIYFDLLSFLPFQFPVYYAFNIFDRYNREEGCYWVLHLIQILNSIIILLNTINNGQNKHLYKLGNKRKPTNLVPSEHAAFLYNRFILFIQVTGRGFRFGIQSLFHFLGLFHYSNLSNIGYYGPGNF